MPGGTLEIVADKVEWEGDTEGGRYHLVKLILQPNIAQQNRKLQMKISENVKFRCSQLFSCKHLTFRDVNMFQYYQYTLRSNNTEMLLFYSSSVVVNTLKAVFYVFHLMKELKKLLGFHFNFDVLFFIWFFSIINVWKFYNQLDPKILNFSVWAWQT